MYNFKANNKNYVNFDDKALDALLADNSLTQAEYDKVKADYALLLVKKEGELYLATGIKVPFKSHDALAVLQVKAAFEMGEVSTNIKLSNGQVLPMVAADFTAFATWFAQKRNAFFV